MENRNLKIKMRVVNIVFFLLTFIYLSQKIIFRNVSRSSEVTIMFCLSFIYLLFFKKGKFIEKIFWVIFMQAILISTAFISIGIISLLLNRSFIQIFYSSGILRSVSILFSKIFQGAIFYYLIRKKFSFKYSTNIIFSFITSFTFLMTGLIIYLFNEELQSNILLNKPNFIIIIILLITVIFEVHVLDIFSRQVENILVSEMKLKELDNIKKHGEELYTIFEKIKGWQHDWNNHLSVLLFLTREKEYDELEKYVEKLSIKLNDLKKNMSIIKTKYVVLDAVINSKIVLAKNLDIDIEVKINLPKKIPVTDLEFCILLGNLLDNSIEANSLEFKKKWIKLEIGTFKDNLFLNIENSIHSPIVMENGKYVTSKKESNHGVGLIQIDNIVDKYNGHIVRKVENKIFITKILIPMD